jgi:diguanylate cyclase (GGDEF)-like protein
LQNALAAARRYGEQGVLISIDLDGFKLVNDTYGHTVGDKVLKQVAQILSEGVRETDCVGRVGGDEFVVILTRAPWEDGLKRARVLESQLNSTAVNIGGRTIMVRASCGTLTYGSEDDAPTLLDRADNEMYRQKRTKSGQPNGIPANNN